MIAAASLCLLTPFETMLQMHAQAVVPRTQFRFIQPQGLQGQMQKANTVKDPLVANIVSLQVHLMEEELAKTDLQEDLQSSLVSVLQCAELKEVCTVARKQLSCNLVCRACGQLSCLTSICSKTA